MKKRALSALLALAMAVSMTPSSVFAAVLPTAGTSNVITASDNTTTGNTTGGTVDDTTGGTADDTTGDTADTTRNEPAANSPALLSSRQAVPYLGEDGTVQTCDSAIDVTTDTDELNGGWYVVSDTVPLSA